MPRPVDERPDCLDVLDGLKEAGVLEDGAYEAAQRLVMDRERERQSYNEDFHPGRRAEDQGWVPLWMRNLWRNTVPVVALGLAVWAVFGTQRDVIDAKQLAEAQVEGRAVAIDVLCGFGNGVEAAGKATLTAPIQPKEFRLALERLGLPGGKVRRQAQLAAAEAYARSISESVANQVGPKAAAKVIKRDGSLNCPALRKAARANVKARP